MGRQRKPRPAPWWRSLRMCTPSGAAAGRVWRGCWSNSSSSRGRISSAPSQTCSSRPQIKSWVIHVYLISFISKMLKPSSDQIVSNAWISHQLHLKYALTSHFQIKTIFRSNCEYPVYFSWFSCLEQAQTILGSDNQIMSNLISILNMINWLGVWGKAGRGGGDPTSFRTTNRSEV